MERINEVLVQDVVEQNMMDYGAYLILQRALPDLRDGQKPVHRRILYTLWLEKATRLTKSANISGAVMKLHPHGDTYGTMTNMVQKDRNALRLVIGKGSFGNVTSTKPAAAARYTEVKLSDFSIDMMKELNKNVVDMIPNYDGTVMVPEVLPTNFPLILTQISSGVALGMASSIPSFNMVEVGKAFINWLKTGKATLLVPDFATGGLVVKDTETLKQINLEGRGSTQIRAKMEVDKNTLIVTELPFSTTRDAVVDQVIKAVKAKKLDEVTNIKDLTGLKGIRIVITAKRGTNMELLKEKLYQMTPLQSSYSANMNVLVNNMPKVMGVWPILREWANWKKGSMVRGFKHEVAKLQKRLHFLRGLEKVLLDIDAAIEIIRSSKGDMIEKNLMVKFNIDEVQAKEIADMKLRNINKDYIIERIKDIQKVEDKIAEIQSIIDSDEKQNEVLINLIQEQIDKYGTPRASKIIEVNTQKIKAAKKVMQKIPTHAVKIYFTREGYIKKVAPHAEKDNQFLKPGDEITHEFYTTNDSELLVFGDDKCAHKIKIHELEDTTTRALGTFASAVSDVKNIVGVSVVDKTQKFILIAYDNNKIAKIKLSSFEGNRKKLANSLAKNANVINILTYSDEGYFTAVGEKGQSELATSGFSLKDRWTQGTFAGTKGKLKQILKK